MAPQANFYSLGKICCGHFKVVAGTILRNKNLNFRAQNTGFPSKFQMKENLKNSHEIISKYFVKLKGDLHCFVKM